jgi:hypothetical protein
MELEIDNQSTTKEVREKFSSSFPGLKIEFVKNAHKSGEGSSKEDIILDNVPISSLGSEGVGVTISIHKGQTVAEIENLFRDHLGLNIQIFRKAGTLWIETVNTDHWLLSEQLESVR